MAIIQPRATCVVHPCWIHGHFQTASSQDVGWRSRRWNGGLSECQRTPKPLGCLIKIMANKLCILRLYSLILFFNLISRDVLNYLILKLVKLRRSLSSLKVNGLCGVPKIVPRPSLKICCNTDVESSRNTSLWPWPIGYWTSGRVKKMARWPLLFLESLCFTVSWEPVTKHNLARDVCNCVYGLINSLWRSGVCRYQE